MGWTAQGAGPMAALPADCFDGSWEKRTWELLAA
jgi:hypothetical protein